MRDAISRIMEPHAACRREDEMNHIPGPKGMRPRGPWSAIRLALAIALAASLFWIALYAWITLVTLD
ncbi:hypothetical protein WKW79_20160 [Variovorax robiniae]|uniref:Uncharacterized protein n=1 Tax=Variovorax robiniae TaxID=1836199 RepID=A0ABU8XAQ5_9BURK